MYSYTDIFPLKIYGYEIEKQYILSSHESITNTYQIFICYYDYNFIFINGVVVNNTSNIFTIQPNAVFMCISYRTDYKDLLQIEEGSEQTEFINNNTDYKITKNISELSELNFKTTKILDELSYKNIFIKGNIIEGKYRSANNGKDIDSPLYFISDYFTIDGNTNYVFSLNAEAILETNTYTVFVCFYDIFKQFISGVTLNNNNYVFVTPEKCKYCVISTRIIFENEIQIEKGDTIKYYEKPKTAVHIQGKLISNNLGPSFSVQKDGTGDFISLVRAIDAAENYYNSVVYVGPGTYDLIEELKEFYGNNYFDNISQTSSERQGIQLKNGIHLIFSSRSLVTANYTGDNQYVMSKFSAFNASDYGFTLENMRLETSNTRYCIHDERSTSNDAYINVYKNCNVKQDNSKNTGWASKACIGGGLGTNGEIIVKNSIFESVGAELTPKAKYLVSYHNSSDTFNVGARSTVIITGNYIKGGCSINCSWMGNSNELTTFIITNNSVGIDIRIHPEGDDETLVKNIEVYEWNNVVRSA